MKSSWRYYGGLVSALFVTLSLTAQDGVIYLSNPSFEDMPRHSHTPIGWVDCGFPGESPPDIQPDPLGVFQVSKPAVNGNTYLGMVVRDNDTWEKVSQQLSQPMKSGQCYEFKIQLARSELYVSQSRITNETANYNTPAKLRIYGGWGNCDRNQMLAESKLVTNSRWIEYVFKLEPNNSFTHLILEAYFQTPTLFPYNGNLLLDHASPLKPIPCDQTVPAEPEETEPIAEANTPKTPTPQKPKPPVDKTAPKPQPKENETELFGVRRAEMRIGQVLRTEKINFKANSFAIEDPSIPVLDEIYDFLAKNPDVIIEVGGHTNSFAGSEYADQLSTNRAKAITDYLSAKGIDSRRLKFRGYGKNRPIASNATEEGRRKNQRVEIKIIGFEEG